MSFNTRLPIKTYQGRAGYCASKLVDGYAKVDSINEKEFFRIILNYFSTTADLMHNMDVSWQRRLQYQMDMIAHCLEVKDKPDL